MRIGILTGGGDCPGLNAVIRAVVRKGEGCTGTTWSASVTAGAASIEGERSTDLTISTTRGLLPRGGTILGSSRTNPYSTDDGVAQASTRCSASASTR